MTVTLLEGHVVDVLASQPANHWHVCVCSPPYWQLRAYQTEPQTWGDGWVGELGQEDTPEVYIGHLVEVFRAVKRVLRQDASLWVNLSGSYFSEPGGQNGGAGNTLDYGAGRVSPKVMEANRQNGRQKRGKHPWLKPLDWVDVPGLFARAMQQDGWTWRSDVVWVKPSALPESVSGTAWTTCRVKVRPQADAVEAGQYAAGSGQRTARPQSGGMGNVPEAYQTEWADCSGCFRCSGTDGLVLRRGSGRPTKATERILLFTRGPGYYFDQEAVREAPSPNTVTNERIADLTRVASEAAGAKHLNGGERSTLGAPHAGRNLRDWWVIPPEPFAGHHYAAFPSALPERCIKAGSSEWGCCPVCGSPWARVMAPPIYHQHRPSGSTQPRSELGNKFPEDGNWGSFGTNLRREDTTLGWRPTCTCGKAHAPSPCRVLDCFGGSGTTALAANRLGRDCTLVELKPQYAELARKRVGREPLSLFAWRHEDTPEEVEV